MSLLEIASVHSGYGKMTVLEGVWGPMIGAFAGLFIVWMGKLLKMN